ncbi:DNA mismatch repair protein MutT [Paenibacillus sp. J31TS4]|uniref:NUDIX hydrolase n=1 Tax=Paenibacillus sp. J31TS4 TaxID=2807195 RepID=UPI001B1B5730|nr:NUDIX domain-containing protein [Paenibacillus sp. J31TS4]GIP40317.1 DNA mismatch repair protein MutT [Paenibacillus sp. J31TS4]
MYVNVRAIIEGGDAADPRILIQTRTKPGEGRRCLELPGGRLEEYESMLEGLKREVLEETGLTVTAIEGLDDKLDTDAGETNVECLRPFAVYQTTKGPVDSMGVYFRCRAEGDLLQEGDDTAEIRWIGLAELEELASRQPDAFCWVDRAGVLFYLAHRRQELSAGGSVNDTGWRRGGPANTH